LLSEPLDEVVANPVQAEHGLRDDQAAEQGAEVQRGDGRQRNERIAEDMSHDHAPLGQAFGACSADVVRVDHVEHRRAHETAVQGEADE
jgi:hypothetical protein